MAKKEVEGLIKLQIGAGKANPSPPVGPALGQKGLNIMEFCKDFNAKTGDMEPGMPVPVIITAYKDRSFSYEMKTPPASYYIKKALKLKSGANNPGTEVVGKLSRKQLREIAEQKIKGLNANDVDAAMKIIAGSARSMGIEVEEA